MTHDPPHWRFARVVVICLTLLGLQVLTSTNYDVSVTGEAGALAGVTLVSILLEWLRRP
jgi:hypothetical protein|tara:strand:- start:1374 stop:1550 length:177 start_codon:yes stop_codon:yes gene_type:complete